MFLDKQEIVHVLKLYEAMTLSSLEIPIYLVDGQDNVKINIQIALYIILQILAFGPSSF